MKEISSLKIQMLKSATSNAHFRFINAKHRLSLFCHLDIFMQMRNVCK